MCGNDSGFEAKDRLEAAIGWWVRLDAGALSHAELSAFRAWLAKDQANGAAFDEICDLWGELAKLRRYLPADHSEAPHRRWRWPVAVSALVAVVLVAFLAFDDLWIFWHADYLTGTGEVKTVALEDGSRVELSASTAIAKNYSGGQRRLTLLKGEAWFEIAPDPSRPFMVEAAGGTTTALGTAFDIATVPARTEITVTERRVTVAAAGKEVVVETGQQTAYGRYLSILPPYSVDTGDATAWRRGKLIFQDKPLGEVVEILGHYHHGLFWIAPSIRDRRVSGLFSTANPLAAIRAIELSLGLRATYLGDFLVLLRG